MRTAKREPLSFAGTDVPPGFALRRIVIAPGADLPAGEADWTDALVIVEAGEIEVESAHGARATFLAGDVLCLEQVAPRLVRARGTGNAVLSVVRRRSGMGGAHALP